MTADEYLAPYLERYAATFDPAALPELPNYHYCLIVPAFDEPTDFLERVLPAAAQDVLVIVIANAPATATEAQITQTRTLLSPLQPPFEHRVIDAQRRVGALVCNLTDPLLDKNQAVGAARKFGNDLACRLICDGRVWLPLLCNTDADATLPTDYFTRVEGFCSATEAGLADCGAAIMPFRHTHTVPDLAQAGDIYELSVRYIARQLDRANCPYAYPALGSTLLIRPETYAQVRGFPARAAGEDFYLLNKIAKVSTVCQLVGMPIELESRASHRVPFGTGPAIKRISQREQQDGDCEIYADGAFRLLKEFYTGYNELHISSGSDAAAIPPTWRDPDIAFLLKRLGFPQSFHRIRKNSRTDLVLQRGMHEWFDSLKVIRFLNAAAHFYKNETLLDRARKEQGQPTADAGTLNRLSEAVRQPTRHGIACTIDNQITSNRDVG